MKLKFKSGDIKFIAGGENFDSKDFADGPVNIPPMELECPNCGGHPDKKDIDLKNQQYVCPFCGTIVQLPKSGNNGNRINIRNTYYINGTPKNKKEETETDECGVPRRPSEERRLNIKIRLGLVAAFMAIIVLAFGYSTIESVVYNAKTNETAKVQYLNPFESHDVVVYFNGYNGEGTYDIVVSDRLKGLKYETKCSAKQGHLSTGDTLELWITNADDFKDRYVFTKTSGTATATLEDNAFGEPFYMNP